MFLAGKTALVTGGGRGIGRSIAERLAQAGARVVVSGRTQAELDETAAAIGGLPLRMDLGDRASRSAALEELRAQVGKIDVLVNNAGIAESFAYGATSDEAWDRMMEVNVTGAFALCRALLPAMVEGGWGRVVNVASNAGLTGYAYSSAYCASKHALVGLTRALATELARTGVTVNAVCPGFVETRIASDAVARIVANTGRSAAEAEKALQAMNPQRRFIQPEEVAHTVLMLLHPEARGIHGQALAVDGGQVMS